MIYLFFIRIALLYFWYYLTIKVSYLKAKKVIVSILRVH